jgi:hypothetical protein
VAGNAKADGSRYQIEQMFELDGRCSGDRDAEVDVLTT